MASRPSHSTVISLSVMLILEQIFSIITIAWRTPESSLLYAFWSSVCPGIVIVAVILRCNIFPPSMMRVAMPLLFLKDLSITTISVPAWFDLAVYISVGLEA